MKILSCSRYFISEINMCQTVFLRLLAQKNFFASTPPRKITSTHIQVHIHASLPTLLAEPLVEQGTCLG
jgi:hypothetical protein